MLHAILYLALAVAYCEAAFDDLGKGNRRHAVRYGLIAIIYGSIAFVVVYPGMIELLLISAEKAA
jgi:hypothetical protein